MTIRAELEELVEWISDLSKQKKGPEPGPLTRRAWQEVGEDLRGASDHFDEAAASLKGSAPSPVAEFARDVQRETDALALRAHMLSRRMALEDQAEPKRKAAAKPKAKPKSKAPAKKAPPARSAGAMIKSGADSVEAAYRSLGEGVPPKHAPDAVAAGFADELDALSEMALTLRQQCEQIQNGTGGA